MPKRVACYSNELYFLAHTLYVPVFPAPVRNRVYEWGGGGVVGAGVADGDIFIDDNADRVYPHIVWDYAAGQDSYQSAILIDLTKPPGKVNCGIL